MALRTRNLDGRHRNARRLLSSTSLIESLEMRQLLAGDIDDAALMQRLRTLTATAQDLDTNDLVVVNLNGKNGYAVAGEWIASFELNADRPTAADAVTELGMDAALIRTLGRPDLALVHLPIGVTYDEASTEFEELDLGTYIEPNLITLPATTAPNDPRYVVGDQYGLQVIDAPDAWDSAVGDRNAVIAVFDSGVDYFHEDLASNMWTNGGEIAGNGLDDDANGYVDDVHGYNFVADQGDVLPDTVSHGTHIAGILGAVGNNATGVAGVSWKASIMAIRMASVASAVQGLNYVCMMKDRGVNIRVTSNSWIVVVRGHSVTL